MNQKTHPGHREADARGPLDRALGRRHADRRHGGLPARLPEHPGPQQRQAARRRAVHVRSGDDPAHAPVHGGGSGLSEGPVHRPGHHRRGRPAVRRGSSARSRASSTTPSRSSASPLEEFRSRAELSASARFRPSIFRRKTGRALWHARCPSSVDARAASRVDWRRHGHEVLVVYGTTEGQTKKIADALADALHRVGASPTCGRRATSAPAPAGYAGVVVAASVHAGQYQRPVRRWVRAHRDTLTRCRRHSCRCAWACCSTTRRRGATSNTFSTASWPRPDGGRRS